MDEQDGGRDARDSAKHVKVLVVDDDPPFSASLKRSLERLGYDVAAAASGNEGLAKAIDGQPHVILTDIQMPGMDGNTLIRQLALHTPDAVVILMSAAARAILERHGYRVIEMATAPAALAYCQDSPDAIHLLVTDVMMPRKSGPELPRHLIDLLPNLKVLCMSPATLTTPPPATVRCRPTWRSSRSRSRPSR